MATHAELQQHADKLHDMPRTTHQQVRAAIKEVGEWYAASCAHDMLLRFSDALDAPLVVDDAEVSAESDSVEDPEQCPECSMPVDEMLTAERDDHLIRDGRVLIGCEGYYTRTFTTLFRLALLHRDFRTGDRVHSVINPTIVGTYVQALPGGGYCNVDWDNPDDPAHPFEDEVDRHCIRKLVEVNLVRGQFAS